MGATVALAFVGIDTRRALVFVLFALAAPPLLLGLRLLFRGRPPVRLSGRVPLRLTAGRSVTAPIDVVAEDGAKGALSVFWGARDNEFVWDDPIVFQQQLPYFDSCGNVFFPPKGIPQFGQNYYPPLIIVTYQLDEKVAATLWPLELSARRRGGSSTTRRRCSGTRRRRCWSSCSGSC